MLEYIVILNYNNTVAINNALHNCDIYVVAVFNLATDV